MQPFETITSRVAPLPMQDVDTDQIIPARYLKSTDRDGFGGNLFADWRYLPNGSPDPAFILNQPHLQGAKILLAGDNFGCGSSREHAPWALLGWGFRAVISSSMADIFYNNALKVGLLPVLVDGRTLASLFQQLLRDPLLELTVDLPNQYLLLPNAPPLSFPIDPFAKDCLVEGRDSLDYLLALSDQIQAYEVSREHA